MERVGVRSTVLASVGYDDHTEVLEVEFLHGGVYRYFGVPADVYEELMDADSHGEYFADRIRNAGYEYEKVG